MKATSRGGIDDEEPTRPEYTYIRIHIHVMLTSSIPTAHVPNIVDIFEAFLVVHTSIPPWRVATIVVTSATCDYCRRPPKLKIFRRCMLFLLS